jgi:hypothetical protein
MAEKFEVHLLESVAVDCRYELAQVVSEGFRISPEKMARVLGFVGVITKPLSQELAEKVVDTLTQAGVKAVVLPENLSDALIFEEDLVPVISDKESLRELLADIPPAPVYFAPSYVPEPVTTSTRPVVWGIFSLLFLILTLTFGVSFTQVPSEPARAQSAIGAFQPKHEATPLNFDKLHEVVD